MTPSPSNPSGRRPFVLLLLAWVVPVVTSTTLLGARAAVDSWSAAPLPAFCDDALVVAEDEAPPPPRPECEPPQPPRWVDVLDRVTRHTEELVTLASVVGLLLAVGVVVLTLRPRHVDAKARLAFRLAVATLALAGGALVLVGGALLLAVASFPIRG